ncbi:GNAT family N-acetyltransferase [Quadrisphaera sp. INWT6]|uniref:GNAT family N-acetyltransferase n=1 Tax=Quadrisphaera sp. INWT6 TaxID=2596917 RepID=UPI001891FC5B|nr:GNAT family N-acetyltransferase [Quadrisphaera sp. INWT6]
MARGSVEVRRAGAGDLHLLEALVRDTAVAAPARADVPAQRTARDASARLRLEALVDHPHVEVHVAVVPREGGEEAVGVAVVRRAEVVVPVPAPVLHVDQLWVAPAWRRQGVGHALLGAVAAVAEAAGVDEVSAAGDPGHREAQRFLARLGFGRPVVVRAAPLAVLRARLAATAATAAGSRGRRRAALDQVVALRRRQRERPAPAPPGADLSGAVRPAAGT